MKKFFFAAALIGCTSLTAAPKDAAWNAFSEAKAASWDILKCAGNVAKATVCFADMAASAAIAENTQERKEQCSNLSKRAGTALCKASWNAACAAGHTGLFGWNVARVVAPYAWMATKFAGKKSWVAACALKKYVASTRNQQADLDIEMNEIIAYEGQAPDSELNDQENQS